MPLAYPTTIQVGDDTGDRDNRIVALLKAWVGTLQSIEQTGIDMLTQKDVDQAEGAQLDILGRIVGQTRGGLSDDDYRRYIRARIATNRSDGIFDDLIKVAVLILNDDDAVLTATNAGTATVQFLVEGIGLPFSLAQILSLFEQEAKSAGVRLQLVFNTNLTVANWFYMDGTPTGALDGSIMFDALPIP